MIGRISLGPVFVYDMLSTARRWQGYAGRAGFVLFLLIAMTLSWLMSDWMSLSFGTTPTIAQLAAIGESFFYALAATQISCLILAAPAAAAGSICIDRARGTLLHMMVTDLSDAEIVLGRLASRLLPVFGLIACSIPVVALAGLLGGIDFSALVGLFVVSISLAILGCTLALAISVKASKTHEVLMAVYLALGVWLLALPIWWEISGPKVSGPPEWFQKLNPYQLVYAPYTSPNFVGPIDFAIFFGATLAVSAALVGWSILRLRQAVLQSSKEKRTNKPRFQFFRRLWAGLPGPTLEGNPVLWREWHRNSPSRLARWLWRGLMAVSWGFVAWGFFELVETGNFTDMSGVDIGFMIQLFFGLLMVAATSTTVLAEERTRGSLDVLLSTPLSTFSIVLAKWWGAYRIILRLLLLPLLITIFLAMASPDVPNSNGAVAWGSGAPIALTTLDRVIAPMFSIADLLVSGALVVSIGVALATWISRVGRAVGASVVTYVALAIGWPIVVEFSLIFWPLEDLLTNYPELAAAIAPVSPVLANLSLLFQLPNFTLWQTDTLNEILLSMSPSVGSLTGMSTLTGYTFESRLFLWGGLSIVIGLKMAGAGLLFLLTLATFNRCLGRVDESRPADYPIPIGPLAPRKKRSRMRHSSRLSPVALSDFPSPLP